MADLWTARRGAEHVGPIQGKAWRVVESQEQVATARLVGSLAAQEVLEELIEATKPASPPDPPGLAGLHYLLSTPFRYRPHARGSRFGAPGSAGIFYAGLEPATALAETAYYRLVFWHGMAVPPAAALRTEHTLFAVRYATAAGARLHAAPWTRDRRALTDPASYAVTQGLGAAMRAAGVAAFEFESARLPGGINVGLFTPETFAERAPHAQERWFSETAAHGVRFSTARPAAGDETTAQFFKLDAFQVNGTLPTPGMAA